MSDSNDAIEDYPQFQAYTPIPIAGCYRFGKETINCTKFSIVHKPKRIHRFFMRVVFGLYWEDNKLE